MSKWQMAKWQKDQRKIRIAVPLARTYELVLYVEINYCPRAENSPLTFSPHAMARAKGVRVGEKVPRDRETSERGAKPKIS